MEQKMSKIYLYLLFVLLLYRFTLAQWSGDPATNTSICDQSFNQTKAAITSDGNGGAIMVWDDDRTNTFSNDIYAQKVNAAGVVQWAVDGVTICTASGYQSDPFIVSDGAGGAIIVWEDTRNGFPDYDIYAQRINASGNVVWTSNGIVVYDFFDYASITDVISDGSGGAILVWDDYRSGSSVDVYAQRIDGNGNLLWTPSSGVPISTAANDQNSARIVSDGNNGAIIAYSNDIGAPGNPLLTIYAQKINGSGVVQWTTNGVEICSPGPNQGGISPRICPDGNGGAIVAWDDQRSGTSSDVYAQRINSSGATEWIANGIAIRNASGVLEGGVVLTSDNAGGAILSWLDDRNGSGLHIYAQRVNAGGVIQWTTSGVSVYGINNTSPSGIQIISDGVNGAIINWTDDTSPSDWNIFSQKINSAGVIQWVASGLAVSNAANIQSEPKITTDGQGGAILVWTDWRNFNTSGLDIYAQRVFQDGVLPVELSSFSASVIGSAVNLNWMTMTEVNNYGFEVERFTPSAERQAWNKIGFIAGNGNSNSIKMYSFIDSDIKSGKYAYRLKQIDNDGAYEYSNEIEVNLGFPAAFSLSQNYPNPFNPSTKISWQSPVSSHQTLKIYDVLGNEVATLVDEFREAGRYEVTFDASQLASGIYLYKLQAGSFIETKKMILLR